VGDKGVYAIKKGELDRAHEEGMLHPFTLNPFVARHRSRLAALDRLLSYMHSKPGVRFGTLSQVVMAPKARLK